MLGGFKTKLEANTAFHGFVAVAAPELWAFPADLGVTELWSPLSLG